MVNALENESAGTYTATVTNDCGSVTTQAVLVTLREAPEAFARVRIAVPDGGAHTASRGVNPKGAASFGRLGEVGMQRGVGHRGLTNSRARPKRLPKPGRRAILDDMSRFAIRLAALFAVLAAPLALAQPASL